MTQSDPGANSGERPSLRTLGDLRKPGWPRRLGIMSMLSTMVAVSAILVFYTKQNETALALEIFLISTFGFSLVAALSYDATLGWRFVDFPWIFTSFAAIVVALINIAENARREQASYARSEISRSFSELIYSTASVVTNDCENLPTRGGGRQSRTSLRPPEAFLAPDNAHLR